MGRPSKKHLVCEAPGCNEPHRSKGFCSTHYQRHRRNTIEQSQHNTEGKAMKTKKDIQRTKPNTKWTPEEERALLRAMEKVDKLPTLDGKERKKRDSAYWNEVSIVMRLDSGGAYNRGGYALEVRHSLMERRKSKENFKEEISASPARHWTKVGEEVVQIRTDISQTYEKVAGLEHSVTRLEGEVGRMRASIQNIERMIVAVCRSYGLPEGSGE